MRTLGGPVGIKVNYATAHRSSILFQNEIIHKYSNGLPKLYRCVLDLENKKGLFSYGHALRCLFNVEKIYSLPSETVDTLQKIFCRFF